MRSVHYISLVVAIICIALLYRANTIPPAKPKAENQPPMAAAGAPGSNTMKPASLDSILVASRANLPKAATEEVTKIENELAAIRDSSQMAAVFVHLAHVWETNKQLPIAAYYGAKAAKLDNSEKKLNFAGQFFLELMHDAGSPSMMLWEVQEAKDCFQRALAINPDNDTTKLALATCYIEGTGETMQGVQLLLGITREKPDHIPANMMLGRLAIQSGQFDKAITRFETIRRKEPRNAEAIYFLAEAYKGKGDKQRAIELFEECKKIVNKPDFNREIDQYINSFK